MFPIALRRIAFPKPIPRHHRSFLDVRWTFKQLQVRQFVCLIFPVIDRLVRDARAPKLWRRELRNRKNMVDVELISEINEGEKKR